MVEPVLQVFGYDQLNRIAESHAYKQNGVLSSITAWNAGAPAGNLYRTGYTYDANGNIKSLQRYHATAQIDNLTYNYLSNKNQLGYVTETIGAATVAYDIDNQGTGNYTYDNIGNLLSDASEQIQEIKWNVYGKVTEVIRTSGSARPNLKFSYDAAGRRITKAAMWSGSTTYTFYTLDAQGNTLAMYSKTSISNDLILEENLLYGSNRLGLHKRDKKLSFVAQTPTPVQVTRGQKRYELSNHLGNVHVVVSDRKKTECSGNTFSAYEPEIINTYDYYPFGMLMEERKGQKPECTTSTSAVTKIAYSYAFPLNVEGFTAVGDANNSVSNVGAALRAARGGRTYATSWGAARSGHYMVKGVPYTLSWKMMGLTFGGTQPAGSVSTVGKTIQVRIKTSGGSIVSTTNVTLTAAMVSGSVSFTPATTDNYILEFIYADVSCTNAAFDIDDVQISYASQETTVDCNAPSCVQVAYQHTFTGSTESFTALSNTTLNATGDRLNVVNTVTAAIGWGAYRTGYNLTGGVTYAIRFDYNTGTTGAGTGLAVQIRNSVSTIVFNQTVTGTGTYTLYFTPSATGTYRLDFRVASSVMGTLTLDNVRIGTELPGSLCNIQSGYLYGFNGQMKDDEVYGVEGTSYTAEYWQYDSRLGRRWNVDPVVKYHESPYAAFANNPIWFADPNGADTTITNAGGNKQVLSGDVTNIGIYSGSTSTGSNGGVFNVAQGGVHSFSVGSNNYTARFNTESKEFAGYYDQNGGLYKQADMNPSIKDVLLTPYALPSRLLNSFFQKDNVVTRLWNSTTTRVITGDAINANIGVSVSMLIAGNPSGQLTVPLRGPEAFIPLVGFDGGVGGGTIDASASLNISRTWLFDRYENISSSSLSGPRISISAAGSSYKRIGGGPNISYGYSGWYKPVSVSVGTGIGFSIDSPNDIDVTTSLGTTILKPAW